jgi:hypothetical protein
MALTTMGESRFSGFGSGPKAVKTASRSLVALPPG